MPRGALYGDRRDPPAAAATAITPVYSTISIISYNGEVPPAWLRCPASQAARQRLATAVGSYTAYSNQNTMYMYLLSISPYFSLIVIS